MQKELTAVDYKHLMMDNLEDLHFHRLKALENIEANKIRVARHYNKKVKAKEFEEEELVWKIKLPIGVKDNKFGKWSSNWEGPYFIERVVPGNAYILRNFKGEVFEKAINGRFLKKYYPSVWAD